jgi:SAM-dependent methyltransferase
MPRRPFKRQQKKKRHGVNFWEKEYSTPDHLRLSTKPSEDFLKFLRFLTRHHPHLLHHDTRVLDLGCGNGRQLTYLQHTYEMYVHGLDTAAKAVTYAQEHMPLPEKATIQRRSIADPLPLPDQSCTLVLDMMTSHFLLAKQRERLRDEILRVLQPGGFLFLKTFLLDGDKHSKRLLEQYPGPEAGTYIHPVIGVPEYVYSEALLRDFLAPDFTIARVYRSHKHTYKGKARKRRTITVYAELPW